MSLIRYILFFFILSFAHELRSQEHPIISYFNGEVYTDRVVLTWNIIGGNTCNGITIFHSNDSINYNVIGEIPGICGAVSDAEPYSFTDVSPTKNQVNYYKLQLGNQGFTTPLEVLYYETSESGFVFFPNPSNEELFIFVNTIYQDSKIEIYDSRGKKIIDQYVESGTLKSFSSNLFEAGNYIIRLVDGNNIISSKQMIRIN